ncbi:hypothetical protein [Quadrisphaera sp. INWT6]|uniref:hypothetical protein n=1 Tax=Quadrisphaera sp. INWT6 TaxID=2596917 RepID=UPI0018921BBD|nr:hypothetical protein [Quadrisphaera sp. INWT6]MBF5080305.1 hypothetical protein [Quadrisphaera sp. INWT6]
MRLLLAELQPAAAGAPGAPSSARSFEHHSAAAIAQAGQLLALLPPGPTVDDAAAVPARSDLHAWSDPVTTRAGVLSCALAASHPWLRDVQRRNDAVYDAAWGTALAGVPRGAGRGMREGVALRLVAHGETPADQRLADADLTRGCAALLRSPGPPPRCSWPSSRDAMGVSWS